MKINLDMNISPRKLLPSKFTTDMNTSPQKILQIWTSPLENYFRYEHLPSKITTDINIRIYSRHLLTLIYLIPPSPNCCLIKPNCLTDINGDIE